jgi:hypothetical protein
MKNIVVLFALCTCFAGGILAQDKNHNNTEKVSGAEIKFETELHDFGTIKQGGNGIYEFEFYNSGNAPLIISNAQGSCGCTVPTWPKEPIKPGDSNKIKVSYDTKRVGPFTKTVTITSNAQSSPKVITIKGVVEEHKEQTSPFKNNNAAPFENLNNPQ